MLILIPTYHEKMEVQRLPVITIALVAICTIVQFITHFAAGTADERIEQAEEELVSYYAEFPELKLPEDVKKRLSRKSQDYLRQMRKYQEILGFADDRQQLPPNIAPDKTDGAVDKEGEYAESEESDQGAYPDNLNPEFQKRIENFRNAFSENYFHRWGYIPAQGGFIKMITSMFIHGGWLHLIGNLLFLWLAGCALEDLWGRIFFPLLYVAGGIVALATHAYMYPDSTIACVGASGAIAALVGAFMIRLFKARINFAWFALLGVRIRRGLFKAPAFIMLPLWFIQQLFWGLMYTGNADGGGIAFWAHIGGFAFGALAAITIKLTGLEKHVIEAAVDKKTNLMDESLSSGVAKLESGDAEGAVFDFKTALSKNLEDAPTRGLLARAYLKCNNPLKAAEQFSQCLHLWIKQEDIGTAIDEYIEVTTEYKNLPLAAETELTVTSLMPAHNRQTEAVAAYERFIEKHLNARPADEAANIARAVLNCSYLYLKELDKPKEAFLLLRKILKSGAPFSVDVQKKMIKIAKAARIRAQKQAQVQRSQSVAENNPAQTPADAPATPAVAFEKNIKLIQPVKSPPQINIGSIMAHELSAVSLEADGIDVRILNHDIVRYDDISFICAFTLSSNNASELLAEVFAGKSGRPYRLFSNRINYKKCLQRVEMVNSENFKKFLIEIVSRTKDVFADEPTLKFLKSGLIQKFNSEDDAMGYKRNLWLQIVDKAHGL